MKGKQWLLVVLALFLVGCAQQQAAPPIVCNAPYIQFESSCCLDKDTDSICDVDKEPEVVCNAPYMHFGTGCCLDRDDNTVCDSDELEVLDNVTQEPKQEASEVSKDIPLDLEYLSDMVVGIETSGKKARSSTGFFISEDGYIITSANNIRDIVDGCDTCTITATSKTGTEYTTDWISYDVDWGVAILKVRDLNDTIAYGLFAETSGEVGDQIYVIGHARGHEHTVSQGIISFKDRSYTKGIKEYDKYLQTDAAVNAGMWGGPVLNTKGEIVAMTYSYGTQSEGINFALQSEIIQDLFKATLKSSALMYTPSESRRYHHAKSQGDFTITNTKAVKVPSLNGELVMSNIGVQVTNDGDATRTVCLNAKIVSDSGTYLSGRNINTATAVDPGATVYVSSDKKITTPGDDAHYLVLVFDCTTLEELGRIYGPG